MALGIRTKSGSVLFEAAKMQPLQRESSLQQFGCVLEEPTEHMAATTVRWHVEMVGNRNLPYLCEERSCDAREEAVAKASGFLQRSTPERRSLAEALVIEREVALHVRRARRISNPERYHSAFDAQAVPPSKKCQTNCHTFVPIT